jgi:hypothetical protein
VAAVTSFGELGHQLTHRVGGRWVPSEIALSVTDSVNAIAQNSPTSGGARVDIDHYKTMEYQRFLADVRKTPPDIVIVDKTWADNGFSGPEFKKFIGNYSEISRNSTFGGYGFYGRNHTYILYAKSRNSFN